MDFALQIPSIQILHALVFGGVFVKGKPGKKDKKHAEEMFGGSNTDPQKVFGCAGLFDVEALISLAGCKRHGTTKISCDVLACFRGVLLTFSFHHFPLLSSEGVGPFQWEDGRPDGPNIMGI